MTIETYKQEKVAASITDSEASHHPMNDKEAFRTRMVSTLEPSYEVDPFSAQREFHTEEDYVDFRSMGWFKAGLIATAEVSRDHHWSDVANVRTLHLAHCPSHRSFCDWALLAVSSPLLVWVSLPTSLRGCRSSSRGGTWESCTLVMLEVSSSAGGVAGFWALVWFSSLWVLRDRTSWSAKKPSPASHPTLSATSGGDSSSPSCPSSSRTTVNGTSSGGCRSSPSQLSSLLR